MVGRTSFVALASIFALATTTGCSSVPDIVFDDGDGGSSGSSGSSGGPCVKSGPEICGDGIDNDCNGRADCADFACVATYSCIDRVPADWQVIAFAEGSRPPCPRGFEDGADVRTVQGAIGAPTCACDCGGSSSCSTGKVTLGLGTDATCGVSTESLDVKNGCVKLIAGNDFAVGASAFLRATAPPTPTCNPIPSSSSIPPLRDGRTCALAGSPGGGCSRASEGSSCVPRVGNGYQICLQKAGANSCPSGYSSVRHAGTSAVDTRACSACSCVASPCTVELELHDGIGCNSAKAVVKSGACTQLTNAAFNARGYETSVSGGCGAASTPQASGTLTLSGETTICCRAGG